MCTTSITVVIPTISMWSGLEEYVGALKGEAEDGLELWMAGLTGVANELGLN